MMAWPVAFAALTIFLQEACVVWTHTHSEERGEPWWDVCYAAGVGLFVPVAVLGFGHGILTTPFKQFAFMGIYGTQIAAGRLWTHPWWRTPLWRGFSDRWHVLSGCRHLGSAVLLWAVGAPWWAWVGTAVVAEGIWFLGKRLAGRPWPMWWVQLYQALRGSR